MTRLAEISIRGAGRESTILGGGLRRSGITISGSAQVTIEGLTVRNYRNSGLSVREWAQVSLTNSQVSTNIPFGLNIEGSATVILTNSQVSGNGWGLEVSNSAQVSLINSQITGNETFGLHAWDSTTVTIKNSAVEKNGTDPDCAIDTSCNGIFVSYRPRVTIIDSTIINNADWGVGADLEQCGHSGNFFTGKVMFQGNNVIEGNNKSGKQNGMGNPGNHPWNRPGVPDGQVCLP